MAQQLDLGLKIPVFCLSFSWPLGLGRHVAPHLPRRRALYISADLQAMGGAINYSTDQRVVVTMLARLGLMLHIPFFLF